MKEKIAMSNQEINQVSLFEKLDRREIKQKEAAKTLGLSVRQVKRKLHNYRLHGTKSLVHQTRGRVSNNKIPQGIIDRAIEIVKEKYYDFGPTLATEKLLENHQMKLSRERLRQEMIKVGLWKPRVRRKPSVHPPRERREHFGALVQLDGSPHDWLENRAPKCNLNVAIDDATSLVRGRFSEVETTQDYFELTEEYFLELGLPLALYVDKHSIFRVNTPTNLDLKKPSKFDQWEGLTQFGRAMSELGVELIFANTAQAKGRVERVNKTLQDRLVKELRLEGISSIEDANEFLPKFLKKFNHQFSKSPKSKIDLHRKLDPKLDLSKILCLKEHRVVSKNLTFQYNNQVFFIETQRSAFTLRKTTVTICERYDGSIMIFDHRNKPLDYRIVKTLPKTKSTNSKTLNHRLDDILIRQARENYQKKNPWESSFEELGENVGFYKPVRAV